MIQDIESTIETIAKTIRWRAEQGPIERIHVNIVTGDYEDTSLLFMPPIEDDGYEGADDADAPK